MPCCVCPPISIYIYKYIYDAHAHINTICTCPTSIQIHQWCKPLISINTSMMVPWCMRQRSIQQWCLPLALTQQTSPKMSRYNLDCRLAFAGQELCTACQVPHTDTSIHYMPGNHSFKGQLIKYTWTIWRNSVWTGVMMDLDIGIYKYEMRVRLYTKVPAKCTRMHKMGTCGMYT